MADGRRLFRPYAFSRVGMTSKLWYREHLPSQCFTKLKDSPTFPTFLNTKRWIFVRNGLDDFRRGCPPCKGLITRGFQEHSAPPIYPRVPCPLPPKRQNKMPKATTLYSKLSLAQQARKAFLADIEAQLTPHPLARYPNLEEAMPPELLLSVLKVLDPDRKLEDTWAHCEGTRTKTKEPVKRFKKCSTRDHQGLPKKTRLSDLGPLLYEEKKPKEMDSLPEDGPYPYENARKAVSDLCSWATKIGSSKIDEEYILKQFDINYESKRSHDVLHTMRCNQVPLELKKSMGLNKLQETEFFQEPQRKSQDPSKPKRVKMRYGAWYLNTKMWKKQRADEPLVDPKVSRKAQDEKLKKELQKQEEEFAKLHGPVAFKDFILRKGYRMPSFLETINIKKEYKCDFNKPPRK